jgi:hypothetical protein
MHAQKTIYNQAVTNHTLHQTSKALVVGEPLPWPGINLFR